MKMMIKSIPLRKMEVAWLSKVPERNSKWLCTWRNGWLKKTPLPSVSPAEFSAVCMSASLTNTWCNTSRWREKKISANLSNTVFNDPVTTISTDMISSFVLSPILFVLSRFQKVMWSENRHFPLYWGFPAWHTLHYINLMDNDPCAVPNHIWSCLSLTLKGQGIWSNRHTK